MHLCLPIGLNLSDDEADAAYEAANLVSQSQPGAPIHQADDLQNPSQVALFRPLGRLHETLEGESADL